MRRILYAAIVLGAMALGLWWYCAASKPQTPELSEALRTTTQEPDSWAPARAVGSAATARSTGTTEPADGRSLMKQIYGVVVSDPAQAERLAREYRERNPNGLHMDENDRLLVYAVYNQGNPYRARHEALIYFARHPDGKFTKELSSLTRMAPLPRR